MNIAIVTYDDSAAAARFAARNGVNFPLLSDPKSDIIRAFGILDTSQPKGSYAWGIAHPVTFLIDAKGVIQRRFSEPTYTRRPDPGQVLRAIMGGS